MPENPIPLRVPRLDDVFCWNPAETFPPTPIPASKVPIFSDLAFLTAFFWHISVYGRIFAKQGYSRETFWRASFCELTLLRQFGASVEASGMNYLRERNGEPTVIIGNHMSMLETVVLPCLILPYLDVTFVVKESLLRTPAMGSILRAVGAIGVGRANPRDDLKAVLEAGKKALAAGRSVVIFPQSTRSDTFDIGGFNSIGVKLAKIAEVPVIPLALRTDFLQNGKRIKELGHLHPDRPPVRFAFGKPLLVSGNGKETQESVIDFIRGKMNEWNVPVLS